MEQGKNRQSLKSLSYIVLSLLFVTQLVYAYPLDVEGVDSFDQVLINSQDWRIVYQGLLYAKLAGVPGDFILEPTLATKVIDSLPLELDRVLLIETSGRKQFEGARRQLQDRGFTVVELPGSDNVKEMSESITPEQVVIIDERYPYNSISVAPFALLTDSFVFFADAENVEDIAEYISEKDADVLIYGLVESAVSDELSVFNPKIINEGGKFDNNVKIVEEFRKVRPDTQVIMTNGDFIEIGLVDDFNPVIFVGRNKIPQQVEEFFVETNVSFGVIVGNYLSGHVQSFAQVLENQYGKNTFFVIRFARSPRDMDEQFNTPQALEYFKLPVILPEIGITSISFNRLTKMLEVTYDNPSLIPAFFSGSFTLASGTDSFSVGDEAIETIVAGQSKTILYPLEIENPRDLSAKGILVYGDYPSSLEFESEFNFSSVPIIDIADNSELVIESVLYDKYDKAFYITISNPSDVRTYTNIELVDVIVDGIPTTIGTQKVTSLEPGESKTVYIRAGLSKLDILENEEVTVKGVFGQRESILFNEVEKTLELKVRTIRTEYLVGGAAVIVIIILILLLFVIKKSAYVCDRCGHRTKSRSKPRRHSCGGKFEKE